MWEAKASTRAKSHALWTLPPKGGFSTQDQRHEVDCPHLSCPLVPTSFLPASLPLSFRSIPSFQFCLFPLIFLLSLYLFCFDSSASHLSFPLSLHLYISFSSGSVTQLFCFSPSVSPQLSVSHSTVLPTCPFLSPK